MDNGSKYKLVRDKLSADFNYHFEALRGILGRDDGEADITTVEELLAILATLKMKIEILDKAATGLTHPNQQLLFD